MKEEIWKPIKGYENYLISSKGRVKSLNMYNKKEPKILKPKLGKNGYYSVTIGSKNKRKMFLVHRLVAEAFIPNPEHKPCINHLSEIKTQNNVENLEWASFQHNNTYGTKIERYIDTRGVKIKCLNLQTNEITYYPSIQEAGRKLNEHQQCIWRSIYKYKTPFKKKYLFTIIEKEKD